MEINIESIDREQALMYMSCKEADENVTALMDRCEKRLLECLTPRFIFRFFPFDPVSFEIRGCKLKLEGEDIRAHLSGCTGIVLMAVTAGEGTDRLIRQLQSEDIAMAAAADAMASTAAEQLADKAEKIIISEINQKTGGEKYYTLRYSPGYGDFPLTLQKSFLDAVDAPRKIGLCAEGSSLLSPVKSVTAVIGVSDMPIIRKKRDCSVCRMKDSCNLRKKGVHCGY